MTGTVKKLRWWQKALLSSAVGLIVSLTLSVLVSVAIQARLEPFSTIERFGGDLGARLLWLGRLDEQINPGFLFVDIDEEACRRFAIADQESCTSGKPISAKLVAAFVQDMQTSGALVVVIDVAPFEAPADLATLRPVLTRATGPWIIAPIAGRPMGASGELRTNSQTALVSGGAQGRLRLAAFGATTDPNASDALVRYYPRQTRMFGSEGPARAVPSVAYLAASLARPSTAPQVDCEYYRINCSALPASARRSSTGQVRSLPVPIMYSLPSLAMLDPDRPNLTDEERSRAMGEETHLEAIGYMRRVGSVYLKSGDGHFRVADQAKGKVVVLGSSMPQALDLQMTPLGPMTGSEIIINATRAFGRQFSPPNIAVRRSSSDGQENLYTKFGSAALGALVMLPIWLAIYAITEKKRKKWIARLLATTAVVLLFVAGLLGGTVLEISQAAAILDDSIARGQPVDILMPILLLGLEGYTEFVKALIGAVERVLLGTVAVAALVARRTKQAFFAPHGSPVVSLEKESL